MAENTPVWDDHRWSRLPSLETDLSTDVCVVGLGGSGLTAVSELIAMGRRVVGIAAQAPVTHHWAATVSYSSTALPVLAEVRPRTWAIGGYSGTGNVVGALAGRAVARRACGEESEFAKLLSTHAPKRSFQWSASA